MPRFIRVRFPLLVFLFASVVALARAEWLIESPEPLALSPDAALVLVTDDRGFTVHDSATLKPKFVVRQASAQPRLLSPDKTRLYFSSPREGLFALDLDSGTISSVAALPFIQTILLDSESGELVAFAAAPDGWQTTSLRVHRIPAESAGENTAPPISEYAPAALSWVELVHVLPARTAGRVLVVLRDADKPDNQWDARKGGAYRFVELDPRTGESILFSTMPAPREGLHLDNTLRWTSSRRDLLEYASGAYTLVDPYAGKITRELTVPNVAFALHDEPGRVIALREAVEEGQTHHYRDYLESGTLKTIRNVRLASPKDWPERPAQKLPEGHRLLGAPGPAALSIADPYGEPYELHRLDSATGEIAATYRADQAAPYLFLNYAFHPSRPEFLAIDADENVHLFRVAPSGLKHQLRGAPAAWAAYTPDGSAVLSQLLVDSPVFQAATENFPASDALEYEAPPLGTPAPVYSLPPVLSPDGKWLLTVNNRDAVLHRFGEAPIVAGFGGVQGDNMPRYRFSPDGTRLVRLTTRQTENEDGETLDTAAVESLPFSETADYPEPQWSVTLPHAAYVWLDYTASGVLRLLDLRSGELVTLDPADGAKHVEPVAGLDLAALGELDPAAADQLWDDHRRRAHLALGKHLLTLDFSAPAPSVRLLELPDQIRRLHRYGDGRHLVAQLASGTLLFLDPSGDETRAVIELDILDRDTGAYLARTPAGRFDASSAVRQTGSLLQGTRPVPLRQVFDRDYQPDLLLATLGADAVAPDEPLPAFVRPPVASLSSAWRGALKHQLFIDAESPQHALTEVLLYQNDKLLHRYELAPGRSLLREKREVDLLLEDNVFKIVAVNAAGVSTASDPLLIKPPEALLREQLATRRPAELHLLVVGVNQYRNPEYNLNYAVADADAVLAKVEASNRALFAKVNRHRLGDAQATRDGILAAFADIERAAQPHDAFMFYFAGHGVMSKSDARFYLVPHDVTRIYGESQSLSENGLSADTLRDLSARIPAQKQLFILDACNSGGALQAFAQRGASQEKALAQLARATGTHWIAASSSSQFATEFAELGHGAFTHTLLRALDGAADTGDKRVTINELKAYLEAELPAVTQRHKGAPQYPSSYGLGQDFPVALLP